MDSTRFDRLTRQFAISSSRRGALKLLAGATVALAAGTVLTPSGRAGSCAEPGQACSVNDDCCQGFYCNDDGVCSAAAECASAGGGCDADEACCDDLICNDDRICAAPVSSVPECEADGDCADDEICCGGVCAPIACCTADADPNARCPEGTSCFEGYCDPIGSETGGSTDLPNTGAGTRDDQTAGWLVGAALVGGIAAAGAVRFRESSTKAS